MYKDKEKQKEANKRAMRRNRAKGASVIPCDTRLKVIPEGTPVVIPCEVELDKPKRGTDIKTFEDLPPDVQHDIETMSSHAAQRGEDYEEDKARRTARAIRYQHLFPDRYESTGLCPQMLQDSPGKHI